MFDGHARLDKRRSLSYINTVTKLGEASWLTVL